jgi:hypothetical protein
MYRSIVDKLSAFVCASSPIVQDVSEVLLFRKFVKAVAEMKGVSLDP